MSTNSHSHDRITLTVVEDEERRPPADPLPPKRGEIGYVDGQHPPTEASRGIGSISRPARHPADRDPPASTHSDIDPPTHSISNSTAPSVPPSTHKPSSGLLSFLKPISVLDGVHLVTLFTFIAQILLLGGTIVAWVFSLKLLKDIQGSGQPSAIFIHAAFVIVVIMELVFLERRLYRIRAERYSYIHPGEILPRHRGRPLQEPGITFAPWNRPPLPTYAAALAQSGAGTGDVEDHLIAAHPPPAYGNTRGSTLLQSGFLRESLRAQRPQSVPSTTTHGSQRPLSSVSRGDNRNEIENDRARQVEETLYRLEHPST